MRTKKYWILAVTLAVALVVTWVISEVYAKANESNHSPTDTNGIPPNISNRWVRPWSEEELKTLNRLINKNATNGFSLQSRRLPGEHHYAALRGLKTVQLLMVGINEKVQEDGLYSKTIRMEVERKLRQAGIRIKGFEVRFVDQAAVIANKEIPIFYVTLNMYKHPYLQLYSYGCKVALIEQVSLKRESKATYYLAQTWWTPLLVGTVSKDQMPAAIQSCVMSRMDEFISDYLAANPKDVQMIIGTVQFIPLEGGFYGLVADNGEKYDPINLPEEYRKDGLRVKFQIKEKKGMVGIHMWGKIVEVVKIERN